MSEQNLDRQKLAAIHGRILSTEQYHVLESLLLGAGVQSAAEKAGVHRATASRWLHGDAEFKRILRLEQARRRLDAERKGRAVAVEAAHVVVTAIKMGNVQVAIRVLKELGAFDQIKEPPPLPRPNASPEVSKPG